MLEPSATPELRDTIGKLCIEGDWACTRGDYRELRSVVEQLAVLVPEPIHCELQTVVAACEAMPETAAVLWDALKNRLYREVHA